MSGHGKHRKRKRGVHKNHRSPETRVWNEQHAVPRKPEWMDAATYVSLVRLRNELA